VAAKVIFVQTDLQGVCLKLHNTL